MNPLRRQLLGVAIAAALVPASAFAQKTALVISGG